MHPFVQLAERVRAVLVAAVGGPEGVEDNGGAKLWPVVRDS